MPQNGSSKTDSAFACTKFTIQRAIFDGIAEGWKKGFLRGRRSLKVLLVISVSFNPKMSLSSVIMPMKVLSGFFRLTLVPSVLFEDLFAQFNFQSHGVNVLVGVVFYAINADNKTFAGFEYRFEVCLAAALTISSMDALATKSSFAQTRV